MQSILFPFLFSNYALKLLKEASELPSEMCLHRYYWTKMMFQKWNLDSAFYGQLMREKQAESNQIPPFRCSQFSLIQVLAKSLTRISDQVKALTRVCAWRSVGGCSMIATNSSICWRSILYLLEQMSTHEGNLGVVSHGWDMGEKMLNAWPHTKSKRCFCLCMFMYIRFRASNHTGEWV